MNQTKWLTSAVRDATQDRRDTSAQGAATLPLSSYHVRHLSGEWPGWTGWTG